MIMTFSEISSENGLHTHTHTHTSEKGGREREIESGYKLPEKGAGRRILNIRSLNIPQFKVRPFKVWHCRIEHKCHKKMFVCTLPPNSVGGFC